MLQFHLDETVLKNLSKNEQAVLQYIYSHPQLVCESSIKELAIQVGFSPATILRLCKKLNLSGYSELKYTLKTRLKQPNKAPSPMVISPSYQTILNDLEKSLVATFNFINHDQLFEIIHLLDSDRPLYIYSPGGITGIVTDYLQRLLFIAGRKQVFMMDSTRLADHVVKNLSSRAILFLISTGGTFAPTVHLARIALMKQIPIIAISPYENNTLSSIAQHNLRFFTKQRENRGAELTSRLPIFFLISALVRCYIQYKDGVRL